MKGEYDLVYIISYGNKMSDNKLLLINEIGIISDILDNIGIYIEDVLPDMKMDEIILDSLSLVSFYIELEGKYDFCLPDDLYAKNISDYTLEDFWVQVVSPEIKKSEKEKP